MTGEDGIQDPEDGEILDIEVPALMDGMRVDRALSMLTGITRSEASKLIEMHTVRVDDVVVTKASSSLREGSRLEAILPAEHDDVVAPEPDVFIELAGEGPDFLVVNKNFLDVVHPGFANRRGTLIAGVVARYPEVALLAEAGISEPNRPGVVHRLDKGTSGLLVIARTPLGFASLSEQMAAHTIERRYIGIVEGFVEDERGIVDAPIGRSATSPTKMAVRPDGRPARTHYVVLDRCESPSRTLVGFELETGRTHQIRVHMAAIGHPIVNDPRYGQRNERALERDRLALHAGRLRFSDPTSQDEVVTVAEVPGDLARIATMERANEWLATP